METCLHMPFKIIIATLFLWEIFFESLSQQLDCLLFLLLIKCKLFYSKKKNPNKSLRDCQIIIMFLLFFKMKNSFQRKKKTTRRTHKNGRSDADPGEEGELKKKNYHCTVNLWNPEWIYSFYLSFSFCLSLVDKCWKKGMSIKKLLTCLAL